ncbi:MAG: serine/threonine protein kinase [Cyanothece sp. SIO2G6]|nr:serine/threonine protein kinase [Cyanothece sp. SIO2G6]
MFMIDTDTNIAQDLLQQLITIVDQDLLPQVRLSSIRPYDPIEVRNVPSPWKLLGTGNYAAVFAHPNYPDQAVKIYAPGRPGFEDEVEVYRRIGQHPGFSQCFYAKDNVLILKRLHGVTLFDCLNQGLRIPTRVIFDIDQALAYSRQRGLRPHDVHGKNVMMKDGRGLVVDISDFLNEGTGSAWTDFKRFYYWIYRPLLSPLELAIPLNLLNMGRAAYRGLRGLLNRSA